MENRKQKFEELYNRYKKLVTKSITKVQDFIKRKEYSETADTSLEGERKKLAKELTEKYPDFVKNLPSSEKLYKDHIKKDCEDSKEGI
jgi:hypothetical protein